MAEAVTEQEPPEDSQDTGEGKRRRARCAAVTRVLPWLIAGVVSLSGIGGLTSYAVMRADGNREIDLDLGGAQAFYTFPGFTADLKPQGARRHYLRLEIVAQLDEAALGPLGAKQAPLLAAIQAHLRDQEHPHLVGKAGAEKLRQEVAALINREIAPMQVRAVLFTQFLLD